MAQNDSPGDGGGEDIWQQGDYALGVGGLVYADTKIGRTGFFDTVEDDENIVGFLVISQTCDIVNAGGGEYVSVCALVKCDEKKKAELESGRRPSFVALENPPGPNIFADLGRVMSVSKGLLTTWKKHRGFTSAAEQARLAHALERKFGRFAFPDDLAAAFKGLRDRIASKHDKTESDVGEVYRSLAELRVRVAPDWNADQRKMSLIVVVHDLGPHRQCDIEVIKAELEAQCKKMNLPAGVQWEAAPLIIGTASELTIQDYYESRALDVHYLCM